ncbi:sensor histidine kinase (plasmid) [Rhizobium ruizarguesonis]
MAECLEKLEADLRYLNSAIAHEARACLTVLIGNLHAFSTGVLEPTPDVLARMIGYASSLTTIVGDIDNLGLSSGVKPALDIKEIDLAVEAETVISSMEYDLMPASITIERDLSPAVCFADPTRIQQVLRALLDNCQVHAPGSTVTVQTFEEEDWVVLLCKDTGPGLPAAERDRAFDRFWRGSDSRKRAPEGCGLGLAIVNSIAIAHHGKAFIAPDCGRGFDVGIRLPKHATNIKTI